MITEFTAREFTCAIETTAEDIFAEAAIHQPPIDAFAIAGRLNITVVFDRRQTERARLVRLQAGGVFVPD
ncbi:MAG: hypothetical protein D6741_07585, partial [Planctomycetota bacterium]